MTLIGYRLEPKTTRRIGQVQLSARFLMHSPVTTFDQPRQALKRLLEKYGPGLVDDPRRTEGLLRDYCPERRREISVLIAAQKERIAADLATQSEQVPLVVLASRLARRLHEEVGLTEELSRWAVDSWALALGLTLDTPHNAASFPAGSDASPSSDVDSRRSAPALTQQDLRLANERRRQEALSQIRELMRRSQQHAAASESLRLAEQARERASAARRDWASDVDVLTAFDSVTAWLVQTAARAAREAQASGNLGFAVACLRRLLELKHDDPEARSGLERILHKRRDSDVQAEMLWNGGKLDQAVSLLEQLHRAFAEDSGLKARLEHKRAAATRFNTVVKHEIPRLKTEKKFEEIRRLLHELATLSIPKKVLEAFAADVDSQFAAVDPHVRFARAALNRGDHGAAYASCLRVLGVVSDHGSTLKIRDKIGEMLQADQRSVAEIQAAISTGQWKAADNLLRSRERQGNLSTLLQALRHSVNERLTVLASYWKTLGTVAVGGCLWLLAGCLAELTKPGIFSWLRASAAERRKLGSSILTVNCAFEQLLFAAFLLGFGGRTVFGRRSVASIRWNSLAAVAYAASSGIVDFGVRALNSKSIAPGLATAPIYGLFAGWLLGVWLYFGSGIRRADLLAFGYVGAAAAGIVAAYGAITSNTHLFFCLQAGFYFVAAAMIVGLISSVRNLVIVPIGVLLAYGLTAPMQGERVSPYLLAVVVGVMSASSVLAVTGQRTSLVSSVAVVALGVFTALVAQASSNWNIAPPVTLLLTVYVAVTLAWSLRSAPRPDGGLFLTGVRYVFDATIPRSDVPSAIKD